MPPRSVRDCHNARQFRLVVRRQGGHVDAGKRHDIARGRDGQGCVPIPRHTGDLATGTRSAITKMLVALGFVVFVIGPPVVLLLWLVRGLQGV